MRPFPPRSFQGRTIRTKLGVLVTLLIGLISLFIFFFFPARQEAQEIKAIAEKAQSIAEMTAFIIGPALFFEDTETIEEAFAGARQNEDLAYIMVFDKTGQVIAAFTKDSVDRSFLHSLKGHEGISQDGMIYEIVHPILHNGEGIGQLYLGLSLDKVRKEIYRSRKTIAFISFIVFAMGMVAVFGISTIVTRPLSHMIETAERISQGDLTQRASIGTQVEVDQLARSFNRMVDSLEATHRELETVNQSLEKRVEKRTRALQQEMNERKQAEDEKNALEEQFRQSQKMEAIGRLAGGIAHDFNNLLVAILGFSALALDQIDASHPFYTFLIEIKKAGKRASDLTRQLLTFSRQQVLQPRVLNLNTVVSDIDKMLQRLVGEDIELEVAFDPSLEQIEADPGQIEQILMNLVVNARDAMPEGGKLTIETENVELDENYALRHQLDQLGSYVMLAVRDLGAGMDAETQSRIFEPFFTTKEQGKGTGLGLSTVYGIVNQSGGHIEVYSELGKGTTFRIYLPQVDGTLEKAPQEQIKDEHLHGSETILLVEDEDMVRNLVNTVLQENGYTVIEASDGAMALQLSEDYPNPIHLTVSDVVMPQMNGPELVKKLGTARPEMKVLYMSGHIDPAVVSRDVLESEDIFLQKPFDSKTLARKVREILDT
jgi:signal transduction histidine kinase